MFVAVNLLEIPEPTAAQPFPAWGAHAECDVNGLEVREKPAFVALAESNPENVTLAEEKPANVEFEVRIPADLTPSLLGDL